MEASDIQFGAGEPATDQWQIMPIQQLADLLLEAIPADAERTLIVAIDGRSASGKTTLSRRLAAAIPGACVVHTDDVAWWHSFFGWDDLLVFGVLEPVRSGAVVKYRPPAWEQRGRSGAIEVPTGTALLLVEGVGTGRSGLQHLVDLVVYVQANAEDIARRNAVRIAAGETTRSIETAWMVEEEGFFAAERPWEGAALILSTTTGLPHDPATEVAVAAGPQAPVIVGALLDPGGDRRSGRCGE